MLFVIWGFRRYLTQLAIVTLVCGHCQRPTAHPVRKVVTRFTLFWIPLFATSKKYLLQCTFCGHAQYVAQDEAERLATMPGSPAEPEPSLPPQYREAPPAQA
jgi:hypothetical protein